MILDKIKAYGFQALCLVLLVFATTQTLRLKNTQLELATTRAEFAQAAKEQALSLAAATAKVRSTEASLQADADQTRKQTNDQVQALSRDRDALLRRLRVAQAAAAARVSQAAAATSAGGTPQRGDQPELPAAVGEEDVREADRADVIRLNLLACYRQYHRAEEALKASQ